MQPPPFGVERTATGHRFTLFAPGAKRVELRLNRGAAGAPFGETHALEPHRSRTVERSRWTADVAGLPESFEYAYGVDGGGDLLDPYARGLAGGETWADRGWEARGLRFRPYRSRHSPALRLGDFASSGRPPRPAIAAGERLIYELHVRAFTRHPSSGVAHPGTWRGLAEKVGFLRDLGVTTVELLPVHAFDETENFRRDPATGARLLNAWGYSPMSFFAPHPGYASAGGDAALLELVAAVDALHEAGIEVVLDVVYNHTSEGGGGASDPLRSFRGLADEVYYVRDPASGRPFDCTGCGNTFNTNHPAVRRLILDSLRFWAGEVGVDGFRFDLASVFFRGLHGEKLERSPIAEEIAADPLLRERLLVAEPWDVTGFSPPAGFPAPFQVWNGPFRDDLRRWVRGDAVAPRTLALRLGGSLDLFPERAPGDGPRTVDFVTCHDGFTLEDLLSYSTKRNASNGENDQDGTNHNLSSNHGAEGPSADPAIRALRDRQAANLLALLLLTRGTPMLLAGDERARSQRGNNNAWCHDDERVWIDWSADDRGRLDLVRRLAALRRELAALTLERFAEIAPFASPRPGEGAGPAKPALLLFRGEEAAVELLLALNPTSEATRFPLPRARDGGAWRLAVDTDRSPRVPAAEERPGLAPETSELEIRPRSVRLLIAGARS